MIKMMKVMEKWMMTIGMINHQKRRLDFRNTSQKNNHLNKEYQHQQKELVKKLLQDKQEVKID